MTRWMAVTHKWLGLLIGLQVLLWMGSGLVMSLLDARAVRGEATRAAAAAPRAWDARALPVGRVLAAAGGQADRIATGWLGEAPVYRLMHGKRAWLVHALDGRPVAVDAALAARLAAASYSGRGALQAPRLLAVAPEVRAHAGAVWRIDVRDAEATSIYVSAQTGEVLAHRNDSWRIHDVAWMLHIMDYRERTDFNHPLVVGSAGLGVLLVLGGVWLLVATLTFGRRSRVDGLPSTR